MISNLCSPIIEKVKIETGRNLIIHHSLKSFTSATKYATTAIDQTLSCKIQNLTEPVQVTWRNLDDSEITGSSEGYAINQGTVDENGIQISTLTISAAKLSQLNTSSPLTWECVVQPSLNPNLKYSVSLTKVVVTFLDFGESAMLNFFRSFSKRLCQSVAAKVSLVSSSIILVKML